MSSFSSYNRLISNADKSLSDKIKNLKYSSTRPNSLKVSKDVTIGWDNVLADPPFNDSETTKNELMYVSWLTKNRSAQEKRLVELVDDEPKALYYETLSDLNLEFPHKIFDKSWKILNPIIKNLKNRFNRPRPYQLAEYYDVDIDVIETKTHHTPAYPSGHTAYAALAAYILAAKYPEHSSQFFYQVSIAGMARMLQGVHYPSDNEASMVITGAVWEDIRYRLFPELKNF